MPQTIKTFSDGCSIIFDAGRFDDWCVYLVKDGKRNAPRDLEYFSQLDRLAKTHSGDKIYNDFVTIYEQTTNLIDIEVLAKIQTLAQSYEDDSFEIAIIFTILYAGMIAEENKKHAILKKRIKRLGMHQLLIEESTPDYAAEFSRNKKWMDIDKICTKYGF